MLKKSIYRLNQTGRLWSELVHSKSVELSLIQCTEDTCLHVKKVDNDITIVGVYVDNLLVTGTSPRVAKHFFGSMAPLEIKDLGIMTNYLVLQILLDAKYEYVPDQEVMVDIPLRDHNLNLAYEV